MKCPHCETTVLQEVVLTCPQCQADLGALSYVSKIRSDLLQVKQTIGSRLSTLENSLQALEDMVAKSVKPKQASFEKQIPTTEKPENEKFTREIRQEAQAKEPVAPFVAEQEKNPSHPSVRQGPQQVQSNKEAEIQFGQKWLLVSGIIIMVLGVGYFLKYSFDQNWIGPAARVSMAYLTGIVLLVLGERFRKKDFVAFGLNLVGGGIATLYFSTYAAYQMYDLFDQGVSFGIMVMITALAGTLAVIYDSKQTAVLGLIGGFLTPVLLSTGRDNQLALMTYMVILNFGLLGIAFYKNWRSLNYLGFIFTSLLFAAWYANHYHGSKFWQTMLFLNIFFLIYAFVPFLYYFFPKRPREAIGGFSISVPNAFLTFLYSYLMIKPLFGVPAISVVSVAYAAFFLWMAQWIYRKDKTNTGILVILLGQALLFLIITVPLLFSKQWITVFWAMQATILVWIALRLYNKRLYMGGMALLGVAIGRFIFYDYPEVFYLSVDRDLYHGGAAPPFTYLLVERWITTGTVLAAVYISAILLRKNAKKGTGLVTLSSKAFFTLFAILLFYALNIEVSAFFREYLPQARFAALSVLWALFSIVTIVIGFVTNESAIRKCAIGLFGLTITKVFFVDMENVSTPFRIISFMVLGLVLILASYLYHRYKDLILPKNLQK